MQPRVFSLALLAGFALTAVLLAMVGVYGVMNYLIARRTREIAVRMALGARRVEAVRLVFAGALRLIGTGVALGLSGALVTSSLLPTLLYSVTPRDPLTFVAAPVLLFGVAHTGVVLPREAPPRCSLRSSRCGASSFAHAMVTAILTR